MSDFIVTVKLANNPTHDPKNKVTGPCPINKSTCTDVTGAHHSFLFRNALSEDIVRTYFEVLGFHVTRIEEVQSTNIFIS